MANKPLSIARHEYLMALYDATNNSHLPPCVAVDVLERVLLEAKQEAERQLARDMEEYNQALCESKDEEPGDKE